jgi:two-component system, LytTR family, response regulator
MAHIMRIIVVDDEPIAREGLRALLAGDPEMQVVAECGDGAAAIEAIRHHRPDLVFLDVQMPDVDGFDVLRALAGEPMPAIVFVTAYDKYAVRAFDVHAVDYLLKPFDDARFAEALARAKARRGEAMTERIAKLLDERPKRVLVKDGGRVLFLKADEIDWIEAADYYVKLHVAGKVHMLRESMAALEARLDSATFFRVHRSAIVNLERVRELQPYSKRENVLVLRDGTKLRLTRSRRERLAALLGQRL